MTWRYIPNSQSVQIGCTDIQIQNLTTLDLQIVRRKTYPRSVSLGLIDTLASREGIVSFIFAAMELSGKPGH